MLSCFDVADYFLSQCSEDSGDLISNLKLQKLVYYAQGLSLAVLDRPLFEEEIEAWKHGPVVPCLYHKYKPYGDCGLPYVGIDKQKYDHDELSILEFVRERYGQYSAWKLREMTHSEPPWRDSYIDFDGFYANNTISSSLMKEYFKGTLSVKDDDYYIEFDLDRIKNRVNCDSVAVPDSVKSFDEFSQWIKSL